MATNPVLRDSDMEKCINNCFNTARVCQETLAHLLTKKTAVQGSHITLLQMCIESCQLSYKMMINDLSFHHQSCELCFEICKATAEECDRYAEDPIMAKCADFCRRCAESCRGMAGMTVKVGSSSKSSSKSESSRTQF